MLWAQKPTLEILNKTCTNTMVDHLGIVFTEVGDDYLIAKMPVDHRTKQPAGHLHGGASVALAETLGSVASALCLQDSIRDNLKDNLTDSQSPKKHPVGIEISASHFKSATSGFVFGKVTSLRQGRRLHVWNIEIRNDQSELTCVSRLTVMIV